MAQGILTFEQLDEVVDAYSQFDAFVVDVETLGEYRGDPHRNTVFWISLAGPGRADAIPCGHPIGERCFVVDDYHRINPNTGHFEERGLNPSTRVKMDGTPYKSREKWFPIDEPFTEAPKQLWISDVIERLRPLFFSDRRKIGHNVHFDLISLAKYLGGVPPGPYGDTLIAARLINENHLGNKKWGGTPYSLGACVGREFRFKYEKIGRKGPEKFPYSEAYRYSYYDAKYDWLLWQRYKHQLMREKVDHIFDLEMELLPVIMDMERTGIPIDTRRLRRMEREFDVDMATLQLSIDQAAGWHVNLNANRQIADLVYETLGHECLEFTKKTHAPSTAKGALEAFKKDPVVADLLQHALLRKLQSTFVLGLQKKVDHGRIHPDFNQLGTVSGRMSCREPNIQQIPVRSELGKRIRGVFTAGPGNVLICADLSQIEMRILAHFTQDPNLMRAYEENLDLHSMTAERVFGPDFTPVQRMYAKNGNFSVLFGAVASTLVRRYDFPNEKLAQAVLDGFYSTYREVRPWKDEVIAQARRKKRGKTPPYVTTILGRKRRLPDLSGADKYQRSSAMRQAVSVTVSGSAADLFKVIMCNAHEALRDVAYEAHMIMTIHDELVVEVPEDYADSALKLVKYQMEHVRNPFTMEPFLTVPIVADAKIVNRWSDAK